MCTHEILAPGIDRFIWPNGLRLVTEQVPAARTVAGGLWFDSGSRSEQSHQHGIAHMLEHMFFKGTTSHGPQDLALAMNALGGHFNAFTTQESLCLHARIIGEHLESALRLLVEMHQDSVFDPEEIERERMVILEEIKMTNDTPEDLVHDLFQEQIWGEHGLGHSILGTPESLAEIGGAELRSHLATEYTPDRLVVSMAGQIVPEQVATLVDSLLGHLAKSPSPVTWSPSPTPRSAVLHLTRPLEQSHFCLGMAAPNRTSEDRYAFNLMSSILGGGASSRIFQEIRERRGLAYSIGTFTSPFRDAGCFGVSGGTSPEHLDKVFELTMAEIRRIAEEPVPEDEIENAKEQVRTHLLLGLESMNHRMTRLAELELFFHRHIPLEETLARVASLTREDILAVANQHLRDEELTVVTIGPEDRR